MRGARAQLPILALLSACSGAREECTVFVAASMGDVAERVARDVAGVAVHAAASSTLTQQIRHGAPAGVFISAHREWMDLLEAEGSFEAATRRRLALGELVFVAPRSAPLAFEWIGDFELGAAFSGRIAVGDPAHVPAGRYAREALLRAGAWGQVEGRLAPAADARAALALVERGEVELGIVYRTDALGNDRVVIAGEFPARVAPAVEYEIALLARGASDAARRFYQAMLGPAGAAALLDAGFRPTSR